MLFIKKRVRHYSPVFSPLASLTSGGCLGFACEWYTQWTTVPAHMKATNCESKYRTMGVNCSNGQGMWCSLRACKHLALLLVTLQYCILLSASSPLSVAMPMHRPRHSHFHTHYCNLHHASVVKIPLVRPLPIGHVPRA